MNGNPKLGRSVAAWLKFGYYEIASLIAVSVMFWLCSLPLFTIGAALLAVFELLEEIYRGTAPSSERGRMRYFGRRVRANVVRGLPISVVTIFAFANTSLYFAIGWSGRAHYYVLGGLVGLYLCLFVVVSVSRTSNIMIQDQEQLRTAARSTGETWVRYTDYTIVQSILTVLVVLLSVAVLPAVVLLLPGALGLLEVICYEELSGADPRRELDRYTVSP